MFQVPLSIIVTVYNEEKFIEETIDSIINQQYRDYELIIVDDGSKDLSGQIIDKLAKKDNRIRVIHKKNGGIVSARKEGLKNAKGKYFSFIDGDDTIKSNMHQVYMAEAIKHNSDVIIGHAVRVTNKGKNLNKFTYLNHGFYPRKKIIDEIIPKLGANENLDGFRIIQPTVWNMVAKREFAYNLMMNIPNNLSLGEDVVFTYPAIFKANTISVLPQIPLYNYRCNLDSITWNYVEDIIGQTISICNILKDESIKANLEKELTSMINNELLLNIIYTYYFEYTKGSKFTLKENNKHIEDVINNANVQNVLKKVDFKKIKIVNGHVLKLFKNKKYNRLYRLGAFIKFNRKLILKISQNYI